ncbi:cytochrome-c peroxidase [Larkinella punicea]|uniref:Cytochrome-c peroxidase n=1 Tax=Larkinella punicea TaxID=2315727 RepID=A0A368JIM2_9BACT|nr:cytochrome-c peroxidase [Larkinella punicea]
MLALWIVAGLYYSLIACQKGGSPDVIPVDPNPTDSVVYKTTPYPWKKPANFPDPAYNFAQNPLTHEGVLLGKSLFFDASLSKNGTISCAFCHQQEVAFAHTDHILSHGIHDKIGPRNTPGIQNVAWSRVFFWDGKILDLDQLAIDPIQNPIEMGDSLANVLQKVQSNGHYRSLFKAAYGSENVTAERFLKALSQYLLTLVSATSKYDQFIRNEGVQFTEQELRGLQLFKTHCSGCHSGELFTDESFRNNGLLPNPYVPIPDLGRYGISQKPEDKNKFRVPSLRNIAMTTYYMHDGRFKTLDQVLNHYTTGIQDNPQLDPLLKKNGTPGIPLNRQEQQDIVMFLNTLTDYDFITNRQHHHD